MNSAAPNQLFMIIPVWFSNQIEDAPLQSMLEETLHGSDRIAETQNHFIYLDGIPGRAGFIQPIIESRLPGAILENQTDNKGKGAGLLAGLEQGLENESIEWFMVRDADGDHRADEAGGMIQLACQMQSDCEGAPIIVIGRRSRLEPPLTLCRAVYEEVLNRCVITAARYALAKKNHVPSAVYYRQYGDVPDLQSGYKLYNRNAAKIIVDCFKSISESQFNALRLGAELLPFLAVSLQGGLIGERMRSTYREQPASAYASVARAEFYASKLAWVFQKCDISLWNAARTLDAELAFCPLIFDGMGRVELLKFRTLVLDALKKRAADEIPPFQTGSKMV